MHRIISVYLLVFAKKVLCEAHYYPTTKDLDQPPVDLKYHTNTVDEHRVEGVLLNVSTPNCTESKESAPLSGGTVL